MGDMMARVRQSGGRIVTVWAVEGDFDLTRSDTFELEWPATHGKIQSFREVDRAE